MKLLSGTLTIYCLFLFGCSNSSHQQVAHADFILIKHVHLLDLSDQGKNSADIEDGYVLIKDGKISAADEWSDEIEIPANCKIINGKGKYLIPGLTDGFAAINYQSYCNAYLYMGITSIISVDGGRRGPFFGAGDPGPDIYRLEGVGDERISDEDMLFQIDSLHEQGFKVLLLMYGLTPDQLALALKRADELDMATIGEMGFTTYKEGMDQGLDAFVHTTRYSMDLAPLDMAHAVAEQPFSNDLNSPKWQYYAFLTQVQDNYPLLLEHAENFGNSNTFLIPTSSLSYLDIPDHKNPWKEPVAAIINIEDVNQPVDPTTGNHSIDTE